MDTTSTTPAPPPPLWDTLLQQTPMHVFLFDQGLVCRYAAPVGDEFLGESRAHLVGRHADEILPPAEDGLGPMLKHAVAVGEGWNAPEYHVSWQRDGHDEERCWSIDVQPVSEGDYAGVLVTIGELRELVSEREQLRAEVEELRRREEEHARILLELYTDLRTMLTPVYGYLQVIARRPRALGDMPVSDVIAERVMPQMGRMLGTLGRLIEPPLRPRPSVQENEAIAQDRVDPSSPPSGGGRARTNGGIRSTLCRRW